MNDTQNKKIAQVIDKSLMVGVDIGLLFTVEYIHVEVWIVQHNDSSDFFLFHFF